jgi:hypothetical protein
MGEIRAHGPRNVILVSSPRISFHFFNSLLADSDLAILYRPGSFDPIVQKIIEPSAEVSGLLPAEIQK